MATVMTIEQRRAKLLAMYEDLWQALWSANPALGLQIQDYHNDNPGLAVSLGHMVLIVLQEGWHNINIRYN